MSLAKVNGLFRLTRDAEIKHSSSGTAVLKLGLACSEKYGDKETQLFIDATAFGKPAEIINQYAGNKGTQIYISGKLQTESWEKDGQRQSKTSLIIDGFDFVSKPSEDRKAPEVVYEKKHTDYQPKPQPIDPRALPSIDVDEDSIPF